MSATTYLVLLRCGHWYKESRPDDITGPTQGEFRVCSKLQHYPERFEAFYLHMQPKVVEAWFDRPDRIERGGDWQTPFRMWLETQYPGAGVPKRVEDSLAEAWKAALASVSPPPNTGPEPFV